MENVEASLVIATFNEEKHIAHCILSIYAAEPFAKSFEILIADGGSTDRTRAIVNNLSEIHDEIIIINNEKKHATMGFNCAIRASRGDYVLILSAHATYDPAYFRLCLETARRHDADNTGGRLITETLASGLEGRLTRALGTSRFGIGASSFRQPNVREGEADSVVYGCFPRRVFERYGLYDERLTTNQDWELSRRIRSRGGLVWLNPAIKVTYFARSDIRSTIRRAWEIGRWNALMWHVAPYTLAPHHAIPGVFAATLLLPGANVVALTAHQVVALAAGAREAWRARDARLAALLPPLFLGLHAAYGLGTLRGFYELARRKAPVQRVAPIEYLPARETVKAASQAGRCGAESRGTCRVE
jgi:glycosyltransferase involved in cell wall biosynthesis